MEVISSSRPVTPDQSINVPLRAPVTGRLVHLDQISSLWTCNCFFCLFLPLVSFCLLLCYYIVTTMFLNMQTWFVLFFYLRHFSFSLCVPQEAKGDFTRWASFSFAQSVVGVYFKWTSTNGTQLLSFCLNWCCVCYVFTWFKRELRVEKLPGTLIGVPGS